MRTRTLIPAFTAACIIAMPLAASASDFRTWLAAFRGDAARSGISDQTLSAALDGIEPLPRVIDLDKKQPENKISFAQYRKNVVNDQRIETGRRMMKLHADELAWVSKKYQVAPQYIVALWAIETNFGKNTGGFKVVDSLATLAWEGRRADFFRDELMKALSIIDAGNISADAMKGSWAGAMGQNQFMPSSFLNFAVDADGDGRKDIWGTYVDVFASTANYLHKSGWTDGERWGRRAELPAHFPEDLIGPKIVKPLSYWQSVGVRDMNGRPLPPFDDRPASIVAPDGVNGPAYIVYGNYQVIMKWNKSTYFATSVGLLADQISGPVFP